MTPTLRAELDRIEDFLMGPEGANLADVLSALRGPDSRSEKAKHSTTIHIRRAAFPRLAERQEVSDTLPQWTMNTSAPYDRMVAYAECGSHFGAHASYAAQVLAIGPFAPPTPTSSTEQTPPPAV